jgi:hypothetical protein
VPTEFSGTWPKSGSMRSGRCWARETWEPLIGGSGCSSWLTPKGSEARCENYTHETTVKHFREGRQIGLSQFVRSIWATPTSRDWKDGDCSQANVETNCLLGRQALTATGPASRSGSGRRWATPRAAQGASHKATPGGESVETQAQEMTGLRRLNPNFVDWLMGWPPGWTSARTGSVAVEMELWLSRQRALLRCLVGG